MEERQIRRAPKGLGKSGRQLWAEVVGRYALDPPEFAVLTQLCRAVDLADRIDADLADMGVTVSGSRGQPRINPLVGEMREVSKLIDTLTVALALPVGDEVRGQRRNPAARAAAKLGRPRKINAARAAILQYRGDEDGEVVR